MFKILDKATVFGNQHNVHKFLVVYIFDKCFANIDQSIFQNNVIESAICENTNNPELSLIERSKQPRFKIRC